MQPFIHVITSPASCIFGLGWSVSRSVPNRIFLKLTALSGLVMGAEASGIALQSQYGCMCEVHVKFMLCHMVDQA